MTRARSPCSGPCSTRSSARSRASRIRLQPDDFELVEAEQRTEAATALLLDLSFSMPLRGHFVHAKKMALALHALIEGRYPHDTLYLIGFSDYARRLQPEDLTAPGFERVYGTNMQHAFMLAGRLLAQHPRAARQVIMVTDGEPTAHLEGDQAFFSWPPVSKTITLTLAEAVRLSKAGVTLNVFMLEESEGLIGFMERLARMTSGRVFLMDDERLGDFVVRDYVKRRGQPLMRRRAQSGGVGRRLPGVRGVGAYVAAHTDPFPPGVDRPGESPFPTTAPTSSPSAETVVWAGILRSVTYHELYVGGRCTTRWVGNLRFTVEASGRFEGTGSARLAGRLRCDFPIAQTQVRRFDLTVTGRMLDGGMALRLAQASIEPTNGHDFGGFGPFLPVKVLLPIRDDSVKITIDRRHVDEQGRGFYSWSTAFDLRTALIVPPERDDRSPVRSHVPQPADPAQT